MPERKCDACRRQTEWGCEAKPYTAIDAKGREEVRWFKPAHLRLSVEGVEEFWACPRQSIREMPHEWNRLLTLYAMYRKGFLPDRGAVVDQSNRLVEIFRILDDVNAQCDREELAKLKAQGDPNKGRPKGPPHRR